MTTGKTIHLTRQTFVGKIMSLLFNMLSRLVITFLPRSLAQAPIKGLLLPWYFVFPIKSKVSVSLSPVRL